MRVSIPKSLVAGAATIVLSAATTLTSAPSDAAMFRGGGFGGFHGGFGGFHGPAMGAFRPGGFGFHRGFFDHDGFRDDFFRHRFFDRDGFRDDFFRRRFVDRDFFINRNVFIGGPGGCWGGWCGAGFATGAVVGAAATYPGYGCWVYRPVFRYGVFVGRRLVNVCY